MATTVAKPKTATLVGERVKRREDPRLITGTATYLDDIKKPGMLYAAYVRSPYGAARINGISSDSARELPGVKGVYTAVDFADVRPVPCAASLPGLRLPEHTVLATDRVYYVGHPVAVVVASDRYIAQDAVDRVEVDYDPLDAVTGVEEAAKDSAPRVHPQYDSNIAFTFEQSGGDVEAAFAEADVIIKQRITSPRLIPAAMETRGVVADWDEGAQELTLYLGTQNPHLARTQIAHQLNLPEQRLRVIAPEVGGGFGSKIQVYAEDAATGALAMRIKKPIKWIESRREGIQGTIHGRGHVDFVELAAKKDGTLLGMTKYKPGPYPGYSCRPNDPEYVFDKCRAGNGSRTVDYASLSGQVQQWGNLRADGLYGCYCWWF
jgi:carbon-monoxide dehydrogenase large subunit